MGIRSRWSVRPGGSVCPAPMVSAVESSPMGRVSPISPSDCVDGGSCGDVGKLEELAENSDVAEIEVAMVMDSKVNPRGVILAKNSKLASLYSKNK